VSSDPADGADFAVIQDAVDAAFQSGTRIEIFPGLGTYFESVRVDRLQVFDIRGLDTGFWPVTVDGSSGPAFWLVNKVGAVPMRLRGMTLMGFQGVHTAVDTRLENLTFDGIGSEAVQIEAGETEMDQVSIAAGTPIGVEVGLGAAGVIRRTLMIGLTDTGILAGGIAAVENTLIAGGADGIRLTGTGALEMRYSTLAGNTGVGIDNSQGGSVPSVDRSIVFGHPTDDLLGVACGAVSWSLVGNPDCSGVNANLSADPLLDVDFRLQAGSPCLDYGPAPDTFTGDPASDLSGDPRLRDYDGDGLAVNDCGAIEEPDPSPAVGEVTNLRWDSDILLLWDAEGGAVEYHVYRFDPAGLGYDDFGTCRDDLDVGRTDTQLQDLEEPLVPGTAFGYLITAEAAGGAEGTLGFASAAERSNYAPCP
jgi:hypothetical protein